ncbi:hypothetical protein [Aporhodopirellula aestuarii]|uniref:Uncharacterized protein n=1 Tax=Aporhodopirellula aestuarii TaxID=2950107 RepID=A0ABT0UBK4_9BACT|nr:hypothetical protein [Aporhodopirellula aestuarii]MCM2374165.1 hypothetical protein [Aporhodopirellula aestuarii]
MNAYTHFHYDGIPSLLTIRLHCQRGVAGLLYSAKLNKRSSQARNPANVMRHDQTQYS